jgi:hypothetical protein
MVEDKSVSRKPDPTTTRRASPNTALCRGVIVMKPDVVKCLVDWPVQCVSACKVSGTYLCMHKDRLQFAARGEILKPQARLGSGYAVEQQG